jgi:desulfoferrodoxin-like iron-binding protein
MFSFHPAIFQLKCCPDCKIRSVFEQHDFSFQSRRNLAKKGEVCKYEVCGNGAAVLQGGDGNLVCCGEDMMLVSECDAKDFLADLPLIQTSSKMPSMIFSVDGTHAFSSFKL